MADLVVSTELDAINAMLQAVGSDPINDLNDTSDADVATARAILHRTSRMVQSQGWDFNTDEEYTLTRSTDNEYLIPSNCLDIDVNAKHGDVRAVWRNGKLWDKVEHTFTWDQDLTFDITWFFAFEELPETARVYIAMSAARKFQAATVGSSALEKYTEQDELEARAIFLDSEAIDADHNILLDNPAVARTMKRWV